MREATRDPASQASLREIALLFLKLGVIGFGGPAAHIAMMEDEVVRRREWLSHEEFLDLLGATNLIPGPNSTEMAIHIGHRKAGWPGLVIAGTAFILPAALIVSAFAWGYVRYGSLPQAEAILYGVRPAVIAVVIQALWTLGRTAFKTKLLVVVGIAGIPLILFGVNELAVLLIAGVAVAFTNRLLTATSNIRRNRNGGSRQISFLLGLLIQAAGPAATAPASFGYWPLFLFFLKVGSVLFGSGYVLLAFLRVDLVERWHWLTESQLFDAIAVGQVTPGPVFTTATFIGYVLAGSKGAVVATIGIFLPAFVFVALSGPLVPRIRRSPAAVPFLDGVNAASLSLMAVVTWQLGRAALVDLVTIVLLAVSLILLAAFRINSAWLVLGGAVAGLIIKVSF